MGPTWSKLFDSVEDPTVHQIQAFNDTKEKFKEIAEYLETNLPTDGEAGRYRAMVKTKLEECAMLANKCISRTQEW